MAQLTITPADSKPKTQASHAATVKNAASGDVSLTPPQNPALAMPMIAQKAVMPG
jgi:hypothetical protein